MWYVLLEMQNDQNVNSGLKKKKSQEAKQLEIEIIP